MLCNRFPDPCVLLRQISNAPSLMLVLLLFVIAIPGPAPPRAPALLLLDQLACPPLPPSPSPTQRLSHMPTRPERAPSGKPCVNKWPEDIRMKLFLREKGDAKLQRNR